MQLWLEQQWYCRLLVSLVESDRDVLCPRATQAYQLNLLLLMYLGMSANVNVCFLHHESIELCAELFIQYLGRVRHALSTHD